MNKEFNRTVRFEYKCRRCGEIDSWICTGEQNGLRVLIEAQLPDMAYSDKLPGAIVDMHSIHPCSDGGRGISDLIGHSSPIQTERK